MPTESIIRLLECIFRFENRSSDAVDQWFHHPLSGGLGWVWSLVYPFSASSEANDRWMAESSISQCALWMTFVCRSIIITTIINSKHLSSVLLWGQLSGNEVLNWWNDLRSVIFLKVFFIRNNWEPKIRISYTRPTVYHKAMLKRQEIILMEGSLLIIAPLVL